MIILDIIKLKLRLRREVAALENWICMGAREVALQQALVVVKRHGSNGGVPDIENELLVMLADTRDAKARFLDKVFKARRGER